jgi:adenosylmethionine-8-amino-7-oxononanoate aminotransferase
MIKLAANNGLLLYPSAAGLDGIHGDAIILAPPLTISKEEIDELLELLRKTFLDFSNERLEGGGES